MALLIPLGVGVERFSRPMRALLAGADRCAEEAGTASVSTGHLMRALEQADEDVAAFMRTVGCSPSVLVQATLRASRPEQTKGRRFRRRRMRLTTETEAALLHAVILAGRARDNGR